MTLGPALRSKLANAPDRDYFSAMLVALIGTQELIIILIIAVLLFGSTKLPALGASVGKMLRGFKDEMKQIENDRVAEDAGKRSATGETIEVRPSEKAGSSHSA